ncbi:MAG: hypothetical protein DDT31_00623 [Syntrophomonadaceae bacterium]|nr:hypothetical protein [Bacillota bacterium]
MSFIQNTLRSRIVPGVGRANARIAIVGDFTTAFDDRELKPFSGPIGTILDSCLHAAGLIRSEVYLTNLFKIKSSQPYKTLNSEFYVESPAKKVITSLGLEHASKLIEELDNLDCNVIVAAGSSAFMALTDFTSVSKYRGYVVKSTKLKNPRKIISTYSFSTVVRGNFIDRHLIVADLRKAKLESSCRELIQPERQLIFNFSNVEEVLDWLDYFYKVPLLCFDIEVINHEVACISFSADPKIGVTIPLGPTISQPYGWSELEELQIWRALQKVLGNPNSIKIAQNCIFDIHFLMTRCGIVVRGPLRDTMIGHSVMFPEFPKGLSFLGSLYCGSQTYWKDMVKFNNIKGEA